MISRRMVMIGLSAASLDCIAAQAQAPARAMKIGILYGYPKDDAEGARLHATFRQSLEAAGWAEGRNVRFEIRWTDGDGARVLTMAKELIGLKPDAILTHSTQLVAALGRETRGIPIVFAGASDPVESGLVASLARPGGNITGFSTLQFSNNGKLLELLKEVAPRLSRVAVIMNTNNPSQAGRFEGIVASGRALGMDVSTIDLKSAAEIDDAISGFAATPGGGLVILPGAFTGTHRARIIAAAAKGQLPAMYPRDFYVRDGGLMSFNANSADLFRQAAHYVDRILKGEKPADLPVQTPTRFELVINLKTARALALDVPLSVLARADEVIE